MTPSEKHEYAVERINIHGGVRASTPWGGEEGESASDHFACSLGPHDYQNGIVARDGSDDLRPSFTVDGTPQCVGASRRGPYHQERPDSFHRQKERPRQLCQCRVHFFQAWSRVVSSASGVGVLHETQFAYVSRQGRLRDVETFLVQECPEVLLARHTLPPNQPQDTRLPLRFHTGSG